MARNVHLQSIASQHNYGSITSLSIAHCGSTVNCADAQHKLWRYDVNCKSGLSLMIALLLTMVASLPMAAQSLTSGDISGVVTDPSLAVVPSAPVTVKSAETGATQTATAKTHALYSASLFNP